MIHQHNERAVHGQRTLAKVNRKILK